MMRAYNQLDGFCTKGPLGCLTKMCTVDLLKCIFAHACADMLKHAKASVTKTNSSFLETFLAIKFILILKSG